MFLTHGHTIGRKQTRAWRAWKHMRQRCSGVSGKKNAKHYKDRGIVVCDRWLNSFENFLVDMGEPPTNKHSIERKNVNGPYSLENCRWATNIEQQRNRTDTKLNWHVVRRIRAMYGFGCSQASLATAYGITQGMVSMIVNRMRWAESP